MPNDLIIPIDHLSYSAVSCFCSNQQQFLKNYILGVWDYKTSPSALVGKALHRGNEAYFKTNNWTQAVEMGVQYINAVKDESVEWGKTGSREKVLKSFHMVSEFFRQEMPEFGNVLGSEVSVVTDKGFGDEILPLPTKSITDLVSEKDGQLKMWDYKTVQAFSDKDEENPSYIMQALFNYLGIRAKFNREPHSMTYIEIKASKNKDNSPQLDYYEIVFEKHPEYITYFQRLYADILVTLADQNHRYIPNFHDMFNGKESWQDFISNTISYDDIPKISHKSDLRQNMRTVDYMESDIESNLVITPDQAIKAKFAEFGIPVKIQDIYKGLNVTMYTLTPSRGVRMAQIDKHAKDLAIGLGAKSVRIQAPIMGTKLVGVEVSNEKQQFISWSEDLVQKDSFQIPLGVDVYGHTIKTDLLKSPHLLIGGATGAGKSVFMGIILKTLLAQNSEKDMRLILIDPKSTEFVDFESSKHLMSPIITESEDAANALSWTIQEMQDRYQKLKQLRVKDITSYRKQALDMPYLIVVIDELADLMLSSDLKKKIETSIVRLAQKARAVGIHLICATQRPSVDVVTGLIKANFPTRIAFMTASRVDSKVILDQPGAETLLGNGDMLFSSPSDGLLRLQGFNL